MIWNWFAEPLLFGVIGLALEFDKIDKVILPKSVLLILFCVFFVRVPMAVVATGGAG
jgi:hypothetical protein